MKIYVEGNALFRELSGVGQYTKRLLEAMAKAHPENSYTIFGFKFWTRPLPESIFPKNPNIKYYFIRFMPGRGYNLLFKKGLALPVDALLRRRPDIVWFPNFVIWPFLRRKTKVVNTIYDLSFVHFSQFTHPKNLPYMLKFVPRSIKKADHIVTISESSKKQIVDYYKVNPDKITIVHPAVDHSDYYPRSTAEITILRKKYGFPTKYILYTGTLEPRKNVEGILKSYAALPNKMKKDYGLVLAGGKGWRDEPIIALIDKLKKAGENIIWTGYVPDEDLPAIYSGASLFVYPTFYEGFGMPPLEAMACGVPIICSDNTSLPEVVGKAAITIKAEDGKALTHQIEKVLSDKNLASTLRKSGLEQSKKFTWDSSAEKLAKLLENL